ncbi:hypothetical protein V8C86DRAFT_2713143 [Haematococcus lacustris]
MSCMTRAIHLIPSFNDFSSGTADDVMANEASLHPTAPVATPLPERSMSNKADVNAPQYEVIRDHMKVNVADHTRNKNHLYDNHRGPSVWEYIIRSEQLKADSFKRLDHNRDGVVCTQDLRSSLPRLDTAKAAELVAAADINKDGVLSEGEYRAVLEHYGSE